MGSVSAARWVNIGGSSLVVEWSRLDDGISRIGSREGMALNFCWMQLRQLVVRQVARVSPNGRRARRLWRRVRATSAVIAATGGASPSG
eukprot:6952289-Prymnesium_polylepis.1